MAITISLSTKELQRVAAAAYEGAGINVMLCSVGLTGYTAESTVANWQSVEQSGNGYVRYTTTVGTGSYDSGDGRYELPDIDAAFTATGAGYTYDTIVVYITGETYVHSILTEDPNIVLAAGQTQTYRISLICDD